MSPGSLGTPEAEKRMVGTLMDLEVGTIDDAKTIVESDIYYTSDVVRKIECLFGHANLKMHLCILKEDCDFSHC